MTTDAEAQLAPPGAGLPKAELFIARARFAWTRLRGNPESFAANFTRQRDAIRMLCSTCRSEESAQRILIPRPRGLEDSSRYWSVWMTLEHLRLVNNAIARTMVLLAAGRSVPGKASTAAVKPRPDANGEVAAGFEDSCDAVLAAAAGGNLKTRGRHSHPWFGPLDALGWFALVGTHMSLHRGQIESILNAQRQPQVSSTPEFVPRRPRPETTPH